MALLSVTPITKDGIPDVSTALTAADAAGDQVNASSGIFIMLVNGGASDCVLSIPAPVETAGCGHYGQLPVEDISFTVAAGTAITGLLTIPQGFATSGGNFSWVYDQVDSVSVAVFSLAP